MKFLQLGTALWGWTVTEEVACNLLDRFYQSGHRRIDCATNYPISKNPTDFRRAEQILESWIRANGVKDLQITQKIGSVHNLGTPENLLEPAFLQLNLQQYQARFGSNLNSLMIHWDNRNDSGQIRASLEALSAAREAGIGIGLSGIRHPELYAQFRALLGNDFHIQCKHNLLQSAYPNYNAFHGEPRFVAYGINAGGLRFSTDYQDQSSLTLRGGLKPEAEQLLMQLAKIVETQTIQGERPPLRSVNQLGMLYAWAHPDFCGVLVGPSKLRQLEQSLFFLQQLRAFDYLDIYQKLCELRP